MLNDLTLDICVPSFRWMAAHRIHRKIPRFHDAQDGFLALQSAQKLLPDTLCTNSCNAFSFRTCWRLLIEAILSRASDGGTAQSCMWQPNLMVRLKETNFGSVRIKGDCVVDGGQ